ncbi:hypothetical protein ACIQXM_00760 [Arthrobacter sp. NPDC097144]|uniref:hypothetical protein n=1 Tax=Arthrobacter sp. NPDC097144 TaxID=3363946 RepID=UPI0038096913
MAPDKSPRHSASSSGRFRLRRLWMPACGALLLAAGIALLAQGPGSGTVNYAWVTSPDGGSEGPSILISRSMQAGALLVLAGAVVLAFWGGLQAGRRRYPPVPPASA